MDPKSHRFKAERIKMPLHIHFANQALDQVDIPSVKAELKEALTD